MANLPQADSDHDWQWTTERRLKSEVGVHQGVIDDVLAEMRRQEWIANDVFSVHLALEEALINAIKHGNQLDADKEVQFVCKIAPDRLWLSVIDEGDGFDPEEVPDPTVDERLEVPSGRGIMLMRSFMSMVEYNDRGNHVVMEKRPSSAKPQAGGD